MSDTPPAPKGWRAFVAAMRSWRTASVTLQSFASGLPLGLILIAIPDWMRSIGVDIKTVGLITLAQAPWSFKILWSPLMDRWSPPFLGRRRGWIAIAQVALLFLMLGLAGVGGHPETPWVVGAYALAIAFAAATQDIAIDAYAVEVLRKEEHGVAVGARTALYRAAMILAGNLAIWAAASISWPVVLVGLALMFLPMLLVVWRSPEPPEPAVAPTTLRQAVWLPFLGFLSRHRALEILAFVVCYKLADNLASALVSPFLIDVGFGATDRGFWRGWISTFSTVGGTFLGGALTPVLGMGRALWIFGFLQIASNVGYVFVADAGPNRWIMFSAVAVEAFTTGLGTGAFFVMLLRLTQKRFSATQYALFSSVFGIPRIVSGPICGFLVDAVGWKPFFWFTIVMGIPGLFFLARFVPWGVREIEFEVEAPRREPISAAGLRRRAFFGGAGGLVATVLVVATLDALKAMRGKPEASFDLVTPLGTLFRPDDVGSWTTLGGILVVGAACALFASAYAAARNGAGQDA